MIIVWKDPNMRLHGKRHKRDRYYFRWHYGKQRRVYMYKEYVDKPTDRQVSAREAFTELRREVARQLRDADLRAEWLRRFEADNEGYKFLHTYVYAKMKTQPSAVGVCAEQTRESLSYGETKTSGATESAGKETQYMASLQAYTSETAFQETRIKGVSTSMVATERRHAMASLLVYNGTIMPIFLPACVPKTTCLQI